MSVESDRVDQAMIDHLHEENRRLQGELEQLRAALARPVQVMPAAESHAVHTTNANLISINGSLMALNTSLSRIAIILEKGS